MVSRMLVGIEGEPAGVLSIAAGKPLEAADLAPIPRDANLAVAVRLDAARVLETVLRIAGKIEPQAPEQVEASLKQARRATGRGPAQGRARLAGRRVVRLQFVGRGRADRDRTDGRGPGEGPRPARGRPRQALGRGEGGPGTGRRGRPTTAARQFHQKPVLPKAPGARRPKSRNGRRKRQCANHDSAPVRDRGRGSCNSISPGKTSISFRAETAFPSPRPGA